MLKCMVIGNIGGDPEIRYSQDGKSILRFNVASNGRERLQDGTWQDKTDWIRCTVFGPRAEKLAALLRKGTKVYVDGRLEARPWLNNAGQPQAGLELIASEVEFAGNRQDGEQRAPAGVATAAARQRQESLDDSDIPF
jgi:single-strand DNA-binding protein